MRYRNIQNNKEGKQGEKIGESFSVSDQFQNRKPVRCLQMKLLPDIEMEDNLQTDEVRMMLDMF